MDQVKQILTILNAQKFWVACGFLTFLPVGAWFMAKSSLDTEFSTRKSAIEGAYSTAKNIAAIQDHPNPISAKGMDETIGKLKKSVFDAWQAQWEEQKQILVWPSELDAGFVAKVDPLRPIEEKTTFPTPITEELLPTMREEYRDYIENELPKLAKIIGASWGGGAQSAQGSPYGPSMGAGMGAGGEAAGGYGGRGAMLGRSADESYIVEWDPGDQSRLKSQFVWAHTADKLPTTLDILYAQEDLWILNAVMNIIKKTNRDATASYDATIKELKYIELGRAVRGAVGKVERISAARASSGAMGDEGGMDMYGPMTDESAMDGGDQSSMPGGADMYGPGGGSSAPATRDPAEYRYVGNNYEPLKASDVRRALSPDGKSPDDAFLVVAKRVPIRLGLTMDQRRIHRLVTECGNSTLMVEVRQVRVNRRSSSAGGGMGGAGYGGSSDESGGGFGGGGFGGGGFGGGGFGGGGFGGDGFGGGGFGGAGMEGSDEEYGGMGGGSIASTSVKSNYDLPVELYGVIYIYNPVAEKKLGIELKEADPNDVPVDPADTGPAVADQVEAAAPATADVAAN